MRSRPVRSQTTDLGVGGSNPSGRAETWGGTPVALLLPGKVGAHRAHDRAARRIPCEPCPRCDGLGYLAGDRAVGARMRKLRERAGLSLRELAARVGVSFTIVGDLERGQRKWSPERVAKFRRVLQGEKVGA